jgi:hypothetical protein
VLWASYRGNLSAFCRLRSAQQQILPSCGKALQFCDDIWCEHCRGRSLDKLFLSTRIKRKCTKKNVIKNEKSTVAQAEVEAFVV